MQITYDSKYDLLYIRFDRRKQEIESKRISDDIVFDLGEDDKIVGMEILSASTHIQLDELLSVTAKVA